MDADFGRKEVGGPPFFFKRVAPMRDIISHFSSLFFPLYFRKRKLIQSPFLAKLMTEKAPLFPSRLYSREEIEFIFHFFPLRDKEEEAPIGQSLSWEFFLFPFQDLFFNSALCGFSSTSSFPFLTGIAVRLGSPPKLKRCLPLFLFSSIPRKL